MYQDYGLLVWVVPEGLRPPEHLLESVMDEAEIVYAVPLGHVPGHHFLEVILQVSLFVWPP